ncbi:helix-turn-helix transcriptional regulator [Micromonospora sp. NPDC049230]|uniref:helix-turn-helix domain-containing protein n=1 Tax=Micromonospora sp. NPDC049230 TaxID=3155502 RepID=UPI0033FF4373
MEGEPTADLIRAQVRRLRTVAGLSQEDLGRRIAFSGSQVSGVETGQRTLDRMFLARVDEVLETEGLLVSLLKLAERDGEPVWFRPWLEAERTARQLRLYEPLLIPGPLQTENYARAILRFNDTLSTDEVERRVAARMERQQILTADDPPQIIAVLDERALRDTSPGLAGIMAEQIAHLIALAELPHIHVHIIPSTTALHIGSTGPFALARSADGGWVGHLENQLGGVVIDGNDGVSTLLTRWEGVRNEALPRQQSIDLMKEVQSHHGPQ